MAEVKIPPVTLELVQALRKLFPLKSPKVGETVEKLMFVGGQQSVIEFLEEQHKRQQEVIYEE